MSSNDQGALGPPPYIHPLSDVQSTAIGLGTRVWQYCVILKGAVIGENVNICSHCFIESDVSVGNHVTVKNGVYLYDGIVLEDGVFVGPGVVFTNDCHPKSKAYPDKFLKTLIKRGASIGGGAVILPGVTVGEGAMIGAGAVVTKDVPPNAIVYGDSARVRRFST
jgi:acetyltransferase-like isoleucine patch superfamily enzyme